MAQHSKRYLKSKEKIKKPGEGIFSIEEAVQRVKQSASAKFDEGIEVHIKLNLDQKSGVQVVRGAVSLPKSVRKKRVIAAFVTQDKAAKVKKAGAKIAGGDRLIQKIKKSKKVDFDLALAEPQMMRYLGQIGKILGQRGLMPNPKDETISADIVSAVKEFAQGKVCFKSDDQGVIHSMIGRASFKEGDLVRNFNTFLEAVKKQRPENQKGDFISSIYICSSMGPAVGVKS